MPELSHNRYGATDQTKKKKNIPSIRDSGLASNCVAKDCRYPYSTSKNAAPVSGCAEIGLE